MQPRNAHLNDIPEILALQERNLVTRLSSIEQQQGFVTTPFTAPQLVELIGEGRLFVLSNGKLLGGYMAAPSWDYLQPWPIFEKLLAALDAFTVAGVPIRRDNSFQYGPVCIAHEYRGSGSFEQLFTWMSAQMADRYPIGATFINQRNPRSYTAHTRKAGLSSLTSFSFNDNHYHALAFATGSAVTSPERKLKITA